MSHAIDSGLGSSKIGSLKIKSERDVTQNDPTKASAEFIASAYSGHRSDKIILDPTKKFLRLESSEFETDGRMFASQNDMMEKMKRDNPLLLGSTSL